MGNKIQVKRGSGGPGTKLDVGELGWSTNGYLYVGNGIGSQATKINAFDANLLGTTVYELNKLSGIDVSATQLNYLKGARGLIQSQLDGKVPTSRTINTHKLTGDITLSPADIGAVPTSRKINTHELTGDITLSAADIGARSTSWLPSLAEIGALGIKGNQNLTGTLSITNSKQNLPSLSIITGTQSIDLFMGSSAFFIEYLKNDTVVSSIRLTDSGVAFSKPLSKSSGGTGASNGADGLKNLFASGNTILSSYQYGDSLPGTATAGRIFFKKVTV